MKFLSYRWTELCEEDESAKNDGLGEEENGKSGNNWDHADLPESEEEEDKMDEQDGNEP